MKWHHFGYRPLTVTVTVDEPDIINNWNPQPPEISWSSPGGMSLEYTKTFLTNLTEAVDFVKSLDEDSTLKGEK